MRKLIMVLYWFWVANLGLFLIALASLVDDNKTEVQRLRFEIQRDLPELWQSIWTDA